MIKLTRRQQRNRTNFSHQRRTGVAVVELAICLPVIVVILMGTIEACRMIQIKQDLSVVAYEGARVGVIPGSTAAIVNFQCNLLLQDRGINGYSVALSNDPATMDRGDRFTVTVNAGCSENSLVGALFYKGKTLTESMVMRAE
ncbi:TadE-like protein [Rubripirellula obstinata]|uniref:TadE-like protein n=1 Tax=Rubripirellula obstinata TaxID=406547 RepID=A0A5B1CGD7_9BACT|nr:TadE family protein [Rubripirellula obstinata]KAA1258819.1 TadE-like protein [Rubripirellula obstinata]